MGDRRSEPAHATATVSASRVRSPASKPRSVPRFQQIGNRGIGRMLASHTIQAKLVIAPATDRYESEADRIADTVLRMPAGAPPLASGISRVAVSPVQRKCSECEEEKMQRKAADDSAFLQRKCAKCAEEAMQRKASGNAGTGAVEPSIEHSIDAARGGGRPLPPDLRNHIEPRLGADLSAVRLHTDTQAAGLAAEVGAHAFTSRQDIFFAAGRFQPESLEGRRLLTHELAHTVQQGATPTVVQREEAPKEAEAPEVELDWKDKLIIEGFAFQAGAMGGTVQALVRATATGFVKQVKADLKVKGGPFWDKVKDSFTLSGAVSFILHYWWGLIKGIFSPITGLIDLAKLAIKLQEMQVQILATAWSHRDELAAEAGEIGKTMQALGGSVGKFLDGLWKEPMKTVKALSSWFSSLGDDAIKAAESGGRKAAKVLTSQLDKSLSELGEIAGEIIGTILVNLVLLVFTEGLGNAISQIATKLGEFGSFLGKFGKAAEMFATVATKLGELLGTLGGWITKAEAAIAKVAETVLKPIAPILEQFGKLVSGLRAFLRKLLGVSEEAAEGVVEQGAAGVARTLEGKAPPPVPKPKVKSAIPSGAADEAATGAVGTKVAPKTPPISPKPPVTAPEGQLFAGISEDTEALLARRPGLRKVLAEYPQAADLFKLCKSECFPSFMSDDQIAERLARLEKLEASARRLGTPLDRAKTKEILHAQTDVEGVDRALADLERKLPFPRRPTVIKGQPTPPLGKKPGINEPNSAEWRYQEYAYKQSLEGKTPKPPDKWYDENFLPSLRGDRPGRFGGPQQVKAKSELLAKEGIQPVENVELGGRFPDGINPKPNAAGGRDYYEVGTMNQNGLPESRERLKLADEIPALGPNDTVTFVDKNDISRRIVYRPGDNVTKAGAANK